VSCGCLASYFFYVLFRDVSEGNHADGLPDTQTDTGSDTTVETLHAVLRVDVLEGLADSHVLGTVGVLLLALHLDTDDLDRLVPSRETTTKGGSKDLLGSTKLLAVLLAGGLADTGLGDTGQTEAGAPVGDLADGDGVDALVDTADTLGTVNVHESLHGAWGLDASRRHLVLGDLNRLHAGAETHGSVGLGETTDHTTGDARNEVVGAGVAGVELGLGCDEEEDGALGGSFDPSPGDETLVDCARILSVAVAYGLGDCRLTAKDTTTAPDATDGSSHAVGTVSGHGRLYDFQGLTQGRDLEEVQASAHCGEELAHCEQKQV